MAIVRKIGKKEDWVKQRMFYTSGKTAETEYCSQERMERGQSWKESVVTSRGRKKLHLLELS